MENVNIYCTTQMNSLAYLICLNTAVTVLTRDRYPAVIQIGKVNTPDLGESTKLEGKLSSDQIYLCKS